MKIFDENRVFYSFIDKKKKEVSEKAFSDTNFWRVKKRVRIQQNLYTDAHRMNENTIELSFGGKVDFMNFIQNSINKKLQNTVNSFNDSVNDQFLMKGNNIFNMLVGGRKHFYLFETYVCLSVDVRTRDVYPSETPTATYRLSSAE